MAYAFLDHPGPIPFAHRGGALEGLENTVAAFESSVRLGYRYLESDARLTSDGVVMAFHDDDLERTCGHPGRISDLSYAEVAKLRVGGVEPIPRMDALIDAFPAARFNLDAKSDAVVEPLIEVVRRTASTERVCLSAFSNARLRTMRSALGSALCTSMSPLEAARWRASCLVRGLGAPRVPVAQVPVTKYQIELVTPGTIKASTARDIQVHVWTIDDPAEMRRLLDVGVRGIMTDRPAVLKEVLQSRGQWFE
jgi:glycerophosphoryl diester phosphodiesterase